MRGLFCRTLITAAVGASACAETRPVPVAARAPAAVAAQRFGVSAVEATHLAPHGYSSEARRIADCLASYPGYDHRTDRVEVRPGVTRRCPL